MAFESQTADSEFSVLTFNVHCTSTEESIAGIIEDQERGIESILKETEKCPNLLIHAQDGIPGRKRDKFKTTLKLTDAEFTIASKGTAGIFLDNRDSKKCKGIFLPEKDLPRHQYLTDRLSAFKLKLNETDSTDDKYVLLVSYHGPNIAKEQKRRFLTDLNKWIKSLLTDRRRSVRYAGAVVTGDFNLTMEKAEEILTDSDIQFVPEDTRFKKSKDFAIIFGRGKIEVVGSPEVLRLSGDWDNHTSVEGYTPTRNVRVTWERSCKAVPPFNHPRVLFHFKLSSQLVSEVDEITKGIANLPVRKTKSK